MDPEAQQMLAAAAIVLAVFAGFALMIWAAHP
jgi:preprotein translocase subunit SecE